MPPKYLDFAESAPHVRLAKQNARDEQDTRSYITITCPHCSVDFVEIAANSEQLARALWPQRKALRPPLVGPPPPWLGGEHPCVESGPLLPQHASASWMATRASPRSNELVAAGRRRLVARSGSGRAATPFGESVLVLSDLANRPMAPCDEVRPLPAVASGSASGWVKRYKETYWYQ